MPVPFDNRTAQPHRATPAARDNRPEMQSNRAVINDWSIYLSRSSASGAFVTKS